MEAQISSADARCVQKEPSNCDADALAKMLDMELVLNRQKWQRRRSQRGTWRALSLFFLVLIIAGALAAYFFFAMSYRRTGGPAPSAAANDSSR